MVGPGARDLTVILLDRRIKTKGLKTLTTSLVGPGVRDVTVILLDRREKPLGLELGP